jgi:hypothetical protein
MLSPNAIVAKSQRMPQDARAAYLYHEAQRRYNAALACIRGSERGQGRRLLKEGDAIAQLAKEYQEQTLAIA